jgi:hypothetical protein
MVRKPYHVRYLNVSGYPFEVRHQFVILWLKRLSMLPPISYPHFQHVVLDGSDDDEDEEAAERNFPQDSFGVPVDAFHHVVVDRRVELVSRL